MRRGPPRWRERRRGASPQPRLRRTVVGTHTREGRAPVSARRRAPERKSRIARGRKRELRVVRTQPRECVDCFAFGGAFRAALRALLPVVGRCSLAIKARTRISDKRASRTTSRDPRRRRLPRDFEVRREHAHRRTNHATRLVQPRWCIGAFTRRTASVGGWDRRIHGVVGGERSGAPDRHHRAGVHSAYGVRPRTRRHRYFVPRADRSLWVQPRRRARAEPAGVTEGFR
jgi:hypothetical protein